MLRTTCSATKYSAGVSTCCVLLTCTAQAHAPVPSARHLCHELVQCHLAALTGKCLDRATIIGCWHHCSLSTSQFLQWPVAADEVHANSAYISCCCCCCCCCAHAHSMQGSASIKRPKCKYCHACGGCLLAPCLETHGHRM